MKGMVIRIFLFPDRDPGLQHARGRKESRLRNAGTAFVPGRFVKKMIFSFYNGIFAEFITEMIFRCCFVHTVVTKTGVRGRN